jgi:hypothetical protein
MMTGSEAAQAPPTTGHTIRTEINVVMIMETSMKMITAQKEGAVEAGVQL